MPHADSALLVTTPRVSVKQLVRVVGLVTTVLSLVCPTVYCVPLVHIVLTQEGTWTTLGTLTTMYTTVMQPVQTADMVLMLVQ